MVQNPSRSVDSTSWPLPSDCEDDGCAMIDLYRQSYTRVVASPPLSSAACSGAPLEWCAEDEENFIAAACGLAGSLEDGLEDDTSPRGRPLPVLQDNAAGALGAIATPLRKRTLVSTAAEGRVVRRRLRGKQRDPYLIMLDDDSFSSVSLPSTTQSSAGMASVLGRKGYSAAYVAHRKACVQRFRRELKTAFGSSEMYYKHLAERFKAGSVELKARWREVAEGGFREPPSDEMLSMGASWPWGRTLERPLAIQDRVGFSLPENAAPQLPEIPSRDVPRHPSACSRAPLSRERRGVDLEDEDDSKLVRRRGFMLTFNGRWLQDSREVVELVNSAIPSPAREAAFRRNPDVIALWARFSRWWKDVAERQAWTKSSLKMELCMRARNAEQNIVHFHVFCLDMSKRRALRMSQLRGEYAFDGAVPMVAPANGRGNRVQKAEWHGNYYCQVMKYGTLFASTNWPSMQEDNPVEQSYIFGLWKARKISGEFAIAEIIRARGTRRHSMQREIEWNLHHEKECWEECERRLLGMWMPMNPVVVVPAVGLWLQRFKDEYGSSSRFPLLVIVGPSQIGKTRYATSLFGARSTLVVTCGQDVKEPNLKSFQRSKHKAIVYDEGTAAMVVRNRALFQSGIDPQMLAQSKCQEHAYAVWLYGIPQIVTTNEWPGEEVTEAEKGWLEANAVVVRRGENEFLFHRERLLRLTNG